ncbi:DUF4148 domain-containing protein [Burkholderia sp. Ac-20384]|uniref:DUF4148 domain-containing protein n=1 Tax=Burkholderia sp. Ac-20384 TaxID=2703902 RepID=UPI00197E7C6A|nr:DUF4148 domain-containing protein [Burkholderia sp. Ac-20384]MBN3823791.1 DUF4148 domain-containing protein [Burkholderia sp. Ac-20384]
MNFTKTTSSLAVVGAAIFLICTAVPSLAHAKAGALVGAESTTSSPPTTADAKQQLKAQRKAERKAARAKKNAELKRLEENGYKPVQVDSNYPQNLQDAQKKAGAASGGNQ